MKRLLILLLFIPLLSSGTLYYVSPSGNDANPGTIGSPFRNWQKLQDVLTAGDTGYLRGGTYVPTTATSLYIHCYFDGLTGTSTNWITILNYPGEFPIYDFTGFITTNASGNSVSVAFNNCQYLRFKGVRITGFAQIADGSGVSRGLGIDNSNVLTIEQVEIDNMGGGGFGVGDGCDSITFLNNDAHHLADPNSPGTPYGGADGFNVSGAITATNIFFTGNRAWWCSDDGFDNFGNNSTCIYVGNWAFWNGYRPGTFIEGGNGEGFKLGPTSSSALTDTLKWLYNNLASWNRTVGFNQNNGQCLYKLYNNTANNNGIYGFWWGWENATVQDFKNNIAYASGTLDLEHAGSNVPAAYNSWNGTVSVSNDDFINFTINGLDMPRSADGCLPNLRYMQLKAGSDLINSGIDVGFPYIDRAPDMGYKEMNNLTELFFKRGRLNAR